MATTVSFRDRRFRTFAERAKPFLLGLTAFITTIFYGLVYYFLSRYEPSSGIIGPTPGHIISIWDSMYFSITTETTLGFGDFRPVGWSKIIVCSQVIIGLLLAGFAIQNLTSATGIVARKATRKARGHWIEIGIYRPKAGDVVMPSVFVVTYSIIYSDTEILRYDAQNFDEKGNPTGFMVSQLINVEGYCYRFLYSNELSNTDQFTEGVTSLFFTGKGADNRWDHYHATAHDFKNNVTFTYEGYRASERETRIFSGNNLQARTKLIAEICESSGYKLDPI